jgi:hypothetical protein
MPASPKHVARTFTAMDTDGSGAETKVVSEIELPSMLVIPV